MGERGSPSAGVVDQKQVPARNQDPNRRGAGEIT